MARFHGASMSSAIKSPEILSPSLARIASRLTGPHQPVNSYSWTRREGVALVDPAADLAEAITVPSLGGPVTDVFVTHVQEENAAGCHGFPAARLHVPEGDEYLCAGRAAYEAMIGKWPPPWDWSSRGNYRGHLAGARNERPLAGSLPLSESLREGVRPDGMRVLSTPGHGKNAVTLIAEIDGRRVGFCGDLVVGDGRLWNWFDSDWDYGALAGFRAHLRSIERLRAERLDLLCPTHGPVISDPAASLSRLAARLAALIQPSAQIEDCTDKIPDKPSAAPGFRELSPSLHQYARDTGNCAVLLSRSGHALLVDDGLCHWTPLPERAAHHRQVVVELKRALGIDRIEMVIPTHYHGDHIENIPDLVAMEGTEVVSLECVADVIERPDRFNLACPLPWYGTAYDVVTINRRVADGARLRWREYELEIFHLGGQTYYHAGVATTVDGARVLFVGDAIHPSHLSGEPVLCYNRADPATAGWLFGIERMIERKPDLLVCGHAGAIRGPMGLLRQKREAWRARLDEFREISARTGLREFFDPFLA